MKDKSDGIRPEGQICNSGRFILRAIREFDVLASRACEVVFAGIYPSISDVIDVREDGLIDDNLIAFTGVADGVDRALACGFDGWDADINGINAIAGTLRERPLTGTGRRDVARLDVAHASVLRASGGDPRPTTGGCFTEFQRAIINNDAGGGFGRVGDFLSRRIDLRAVINKGWISNPQRIFLIVDPRVCAAALPAVGINRFVGGVAHEQMQMWTGRVAGGAADAKHFAMREEGASR